MKSEPEQQDIVGEPSAISSSPTPNLKKEMPVFDSIDMEALNKKIAAVKKIRTVSG